MIQQDSPSANNVAIYFIDTDHAELTLIFTGGTRSPVANPQATWASAVAEEYILVNIGGGGMVALDPQLALEAMSEDLNP